MTYKPEQRSSYERVDISQTITKTLTPSTSATREHLKNLRKSSGQTHGEIEMPEAAPLVFPALDQLAATTGDEEQKQNALKKSKKFVADYFDRRAQAEYVRETYQARGWSLY